MPNPQQPRLPHPPAKGRGPRRDWEDWGYSRESQATPGALDWNKDPGLWLGLECSDCTLAPRVRLRQMRGRAAAGRGWGEAGEGAWLSRRWAGDAQSSSLLPTGYPGMWHLFSPTGSLGTPPETTHYDYKHCSSGIREEELPLGVPVIKSSMFSPMEEGMAST